MKRVFAAVLAVLVCLTGQALADSEAPDLWGVAIGVRAAQIPFKTETDTVYEAVPLLFYDQGRFFWHGLEAGFRVYDQGAWQVSGLARYRFFDIPKEYQNEIREDGVDFGGQLKYRFSPRFDTDLEVLTESRGYVHANAWASFHFETAKWDFEPYVRLRWKSDQFNNTFYGLGRDTPGNAIDYLVGTDIRLHVYKNLYLLGQAQLLFLDSKTRGAEVVDRSTQATGFLGLGFFNDKNKPRVSSLKSKPYLRLAHGWATPSSLGDIITFQGEKDPHNGQMTSLFYGIPVADDLFEIPMSVYFTPGVVLHHDSEVQDNSLEYVIALKLYYTFNWPFVWRFGAAEGLSYAKDIPYLERQEMYEKDYRPSELLNFLDFSLDISLGKLFKAKSIEDLWLGYSIHHRSGIFSTSSAFGRISGGSNINSVYLQYHW